MYSPVRIESLSKRRINKISAWQSSAATSDDDKNNLFVWGTGIFGMLPRPKQIRTQERLIDVKVGGAFMALVEEQGSVMVWGANQNGEIGLGAHTEPCVAPRTLETISNKAVSAVAVGSCFAFAIG